MQSCYTSLVSSPALAPHPLIREAIYLHEIAQLTDADIARATGVARSTARAWLAHTRSPTGERAERLIELSALVERLARVMEPSYIAVWLRKPVPTLAESKPIRVIASGITKACGRVGLGARRGFFLVGLHVTASGVQRVSVAGDVAAGGHLRARRASLPRL